MTCYQHMSRIDAEDAPAPPSVMLTLRKHTSSRHAPATSHHVAQAPFASLAERVSSTLTCCVELVSLLTLSLSIATLGVHPRIRPAWRPAARDLMRLARGLRGCCGSAPPSRHITSRPRRQRRTANGERPSVAMATRMYVSVRTHALVHAPSESTLTTHDLSDAHESNRC